MENEQAKCPVFPDIPCPRGAEAARECLARLEGDFDPIADIQDYLILNCALARAEELRTQKRYM